MFIPKVCSLGSETLKWKFLSRYFFDTFTKEIVKYGFIENILSTAVRYDNTSHNFSLFNEPKSERNSLTKNSLTM